MKEGEAIIIVHGGAGNVAKALHEMAVQHVQVAVRSGLDALRDGDCEDAAVAAVKHLERTPCYNAGVGSCMNLEGKFETDAGIMRSIDGAVGGVAAVPELADPIVVAREVMCSSKHSVLAGAGAAAFARERGVGTFGHEAMWTQKAQNRFDRALAGKIERDGRADTVGAVVLDADGNLCVAGSTGGVLLKTPGRVGDTPFVGAGFLAHPKLGTAAATGVGEAIMARSFCFALLDRHAREGGSLQAHAQAMCNELRKETGSAVGVIAISPDGQVAIAHACKHMSWALARGTQPIASGLSVDGSASA
jgi:beta-aspartyl-peptidase (threonine type)